MNVNKPFPKALPNILSHQPIALSGMEHPLFIPLPSYNSVLDNPPQMGPVPILNQQLLVPLAAFQTANDSPSPLVTTISDSSSISQPINPSHLGIHTLPKPPALGLNLVTTKANANSVPLITDSDYSQILNQALYIQSKSILNQNIPVQYTLNQNINEKDRSKNNVTTQDSETESKNQKIFDLKPTKSVSGDICFTQSSNFSTSDLRSNYSNAKNHQDSKTIRSSNNGIIRDLDSENISKVISSLPPGWKIVGLTHLADGSQPTPVVETNDRITCTNAASGDCASHMPSPPHHRCGVPEVVSVDLNIPTTLSLSADIFNDSLDKKSKMGNIVLPMDLSDISYPKPQINKTGLLSFSNSSQDIKGSDQCQVKVKKEFDAISAEASQNNFDLDISKNEWKVVGLTTSSLSQTSVTEKNPQISNVPLPFPLLLSSDLEGSAEDRVIHSRSPKAATILNVPTPKLIQQSVKPLSPQNLTALDSSSCDEVRWTIVGVTMGNTTYATNGSDAISTSMMKVKNVSSDNIRPDCAVTHCQQRPVSCSESKNAPLLLDTSQKGIDSTVIKDQWKVVGVTHSTNENQSTPIPPISYQIPVPLPQVQQLPQTSPFSSISSSTTINTKLNSNNSAVTTPSTTCLSANNSILSNNNTMSVISPSLLTSLTGPNNTLLESQQQQQQLLLNIVQNQLHLQLQQQQQEQQELMMSQIQSQLALQNQIPYMNSRNEWNLVGLLSNIPQTLVTNNSSDDKDYKKNIDTMNKPVATKGTTKNMNKDVLVSSTTKKSKNHEDSLSDLKKPRQSRNRDMAAKFTKKNTVSHLLKLKRMKMKAGEDGSLSHSDQEGYEVDKNMKQVKDQMALLSKSDKAFRSRPLHSYAGNRKIFSKSFTAQKDEEKPKINLRSGNQVPVSETDFSYDKKNWSEEGEDLAAQVPDSIEVHNDSSPPSDTRSSARKRKLKIPRKMVADVDYQPFDSSSDSN